MAARSRFTQSRESMSKACRRFEAWLRTQGYGSCTEMYPAALSAVSLISDYFQDYPEREADWDEVEGHAEEIGWISDYDVEHMDDDDE